MRVQLGFAVAVAVVLAGCGTTPIARPAPEIFICPPVEPVVRDTAGDVVECPTKGDVNGGNVRDAYLGFLKCRALYHAGRRAREACVKRAREIQR